MEVTALGVENDVGGVRLQPLGSPLAGGVDESGGGPGDRGAGELHRTRSDGQATGLDEVGVAVHDPDPLQRHSGGVGDDHRPRRVVALPVRRRPARHDEPAVVGELDRRQFGSLDGGRHLDVRGQADAEGERVGGGSPGGLLGAQARRSRRCRAHGAATPG